MLAAETGAGLPTKIPAAERQVTRLGAGVFQDARIAPDTLAFLTENLSRMAQIYRKLDVIGVRAVATSAVRDAINQREFLEKTSQALDATVEIISGQEEARLIHLGVGARWPRQDGSCPATEVFLKSDPPAPRELHRMNQYIDEKLATPVRRISLGPDIHPSRPSMPIPGASSRSCRRFCALRTVWIAATSSEFAASRSSFETARSRLRSSAASILTWSCGP